MKLRIEENISLAEYTTLNVGGVVRYFTVLTDVANLLPITEYSKSAGVPIFVFGGGSNILVCDGQLPVLAIKNELKGIELELVANGDTIVTAAAGESWDEFVATVVAKGFSGLENLSGIPGTVGASPIQNINAYGSSVSDTIEKVTVFDISTKQERVMEKSECMFGYRDSVFKKPAGANLVVTAVSFRLKPAVQSNLTYRSASQSIERYLVDKNICNPSASDIRQAVLQVRKNIGMVSGCFHSAGSFFKNTIVSSSEFAQAEEIVREKFSDISERLSPWHWVLSDGTVKISTAFLMECTQYNKTTYGKKRWRDVVGLSPLHSLSIVTESGATATDVIEFSNLIIEEVEKIFKIKIESEVNFIKY